MCARFELGFIGAGNMAEGIARALVRSGVFPGDRLIASDPADARRAVFEKLGVTTTDDNRRVATESAALILAVKPQAFAAVAAELRGAIGTDAPVISIMAGVSTATIATELGEASLRVVRVMPNLPILVGAGVAALCGGKHARAQDVALARRIFDAGGATVIMEDESQIDAVTAVSGSGPAYFYAFVEAIVAGGVAAGLREADALTLARNTCLGAARMMLETDDPPATLRRKVTSPGGTTQRALETMAAGGVHETIKRAVVAAAERSRELGKG